MDQGDPTRTTLLGNTQGPVGSNDWGFPAKFWLAQVATTGDGVHLSLAVGTAPDGTVDTALAFKPSEAGDAGDYLTVTQGQVTFDAEGNDDPKSPHFSRVLHWPGGKSGVTIGRGYDLKSRNAGSVESDLTKASLDNETAKAIAKGVGLSGQAAMDFVAMNKLKVGEISGFVQHSLFENIYPDYLERGRKNYEYWTSTEKDRVLWNNLHPAIRDILVDFVYQGFTAGARPMVKGMKNDFDELISYIQSTPDLSRYEPGRQRVAYLKRHKPAR
ncbi:MAG: hypothetical protein HY854_10545 [Burkholderiales bacterium]|nr:hypothetical protein [Burkholderiales bacterium]